MKKKNIQYLLISIAAIIFLALNFGLKPHMIKQEAIKTTNEVLNLWVEGNLMASAVYWEKQQEYPPLYGIVSYKIEETDFYKKDSSLYAKIAARLTFTKNNIYADQDAWTFILRRDVGVWKVVNFYPTGTPPEEWDL